MNCLCNVGKSGLVLPPTSVTVTKKTKTLYFQGLRQQKGSSHELNNFCDSDKEEKSYAK